MNRSSRIYQLKITLLESDPPIWRRLLVPTESTLAKLHETFQTVMGWQDCHLHEFRIGDRRFGRPDMEDRLVVGRPLEDERYVCVIAALPHVGAKAIYAYDLGDDWRHELVVEDIRDTEKTLSNAVCLEGEFRCPPEDCGGMLGYGRLLQILDDRYHPEYKAMRRWVGQDFDPDVFPIDTVNQELARLGQCEDREP